ncbi:FAD binding domain-containing protein [Demetria terragena]|uniref:FAD binding domain-containing protein n=1 Tax=Demetria terragena TaxID=63959 RepID=UPI000361A845|nr:xanthine dehydrogenase family protein subunit M [Demetria terragena]
MKPFDYQRPSSVEDAVQLLADTPGSRPLGGGTNLVDLMRVNIEQPEQLIDVTALGLTNITHLDDRVRVEAGVRNSDLANDALLRERLPLVSAALVSGASAQLRNMATVGGNLMQRSRCSYFYDPHAACNKRQLGSGCDARAGFHRLGAVLGTSDACLSAHPSDLCVALAAADATVQVRSRDGEREIALTDFHRLPGDRPDIETALEPGELITSIEIPYLPSGFRSSYRKVRDRASYAFALVSVAAALRVEDGVVTDVRLALGGVGTKPWRATAAEEYLRGRPATATEFTAAADAELAAAQPTPDLEFKVALARRTVTATLRDLVEVSA